MTTVTIQDRPVLHFPRSGRAHVPFRRGVNHVLVEAVDRAGRSHTFFLDTGASFSVVTPRYVDSTEARDTRPGAPEAVYGAHGALPGTPSLHTLRDLRLGDLVIESAGAVSLELPKIEERMGIEIHGVIGYNVLSHVVTVIDYPAGEVLFLDPENRRAAAELGQPKHVLPFRLRMGVIIELRGSVNGGGEIPFLVDIGSRYTFLNRPAARASGVKLARESDDAVALGCGAAAGTPVETGRAENLRLGPVAYDQPEIRAIDLPVFATLGFGVDDPAGSSATTC